MTIIKNITQLKKLAGKGEGIEVSILLNFGMMSSKHIAYDKKEELFYIDNYIDGTSQKLTGEELADLTNIVKAMDKNALIIK